jgi:hypothetical protein
MSQQTSTPKKTEGDCTVQELLASGGNARVYRGKDYCSVCLLFCRRSTKLAAAQW